MFCFRPSDRIELWGFVRSHFGLSLPHRVFTPGHSTALDFIWDALVNPGCDIAAWACRSGGKTLSASILAAIEHAFIDSLQCRVLSGSEDQARNLYGYWQRWCNGLLADRVEGKVSKQLTNIASGKLEILAASHRRVRGPKVHRVYEDELDEIDSDIDIAAAGMIASSGSIKARTIYTSTWHRMDGPMSVLIEGCPGNGVRLHRWNIWEAVENCPPDRHDHGKGCQSCPLSVPCLAKARQWSKNPDRQVGVAASATGLYQLDDLIKAYLKVGTATWESEYLCSRPSVEGLVFPEFRTDTHRCDELPRNLRIYRSVDWGHRVFVCLWIGEDLDGNAYVLDSYRAEAGTVHQHVRYIQKHRLRNIAATYCDPAGRNRNDQTGKSNIDIFREAGITCRYTLDPKLRDVRNGLRLVSSALAPASGGVRLYYAPQSGNDIFVKAMQSYRNRKVNGIWIDEPQDPQQFEHIPDALRYYYVNRHRSTKPVAVVGFAMA